MFLPERFYKCCKAGDVPSCQLAQFSKLNFRQLLWTGDLFAILRNASILQKQGGVGCLKPGHVHCVYYQLLSVGSVPQADEESPF